jgi:hypothetical protein
MMIKIISRIASEGFAIASTRFAAACRAFIGRIQRRKRS